MRGNVKSTSLVSVAVATTAALLAYGLIVLAEVSATRQVLLPAILLTLLAVLIIAIRSYQRSTGTWEPLFHPRVGPLAYMCYALLVPPLYMAVTGSGIGSISHATLTAPTVAVMILTVAVYVLGTFAGDLSSRGKHVVTGRIVVKPLPSTSGGTSVWTRLLMFGRVVLLLALAAKLYQLRTSGSVFTGVYGADQTSFSTATSIAVIGESLVAVGALMIMLANTQLGVDPLRKLDLLLLVSVLFVAVLLLGSRGEALAPLILYVWFRAAVGKRIRRAWLLAGTAGLGLFLVLVWQLRTSAQLTAEYPPVQQLLWQTSSPQLLTATVTGLVPASADFYQGSTYLNALKYFAPGPVSRALFGEPEATGALAYRDLIQFTDPNQGFGFALPTEAYLNFGFAGVVTIAFLLGYLFQVSYRRAIAHEQGHTVSMVLYPLLVSYLPYGLRTDFLGQSKSIIYPLIIILLCYLIARGEPARERSPMGNAARPETTRNLSPVAQRHESI